MHLGFLWSYEGSRTLILAVVELSRISFRTAKVPRSIRWRYEPLPAAPLGVKDVPRPCLRPIGAWRSLQPASHHFGCPRGSGAVALWPLWRMP